MSLGRLLTTGKSLVNFKDSAGHYQMRSKNLLPKFGSAKNPFSPENSNASRCECVSAPKEPPVQSEPDPAAIKATALKDSAPVISAPRNGAVAKQRKTRIAVKWRDWLGKLNPTALWPKRSTTVKPPVSRFSKTPVQCELSLDKVRVVRNDLNDSDVDVVVTTKVTAKKADSDRVETAETTAELLKT